MHTATPPPLRSVLYVPAANDKALAKVAGLACDAVIVDLEDAVAPEEKTIARERMVRFFAGRARDGRPLAVRINALASIWGADDLEAARACRPDAILLPKVETPRDVLEANDRLDGAEAAPGLALWAMVETPRAILNLGAIAELGRDRGARLACLVAGTNDLVKETGVVMTADRQWLLAWLQQIVLAARAGGLAALDGVSNDFRDLDALARECRQGAAMGFDGKTLIHPAQIGPAEIAFSPSAEEIAQAERIVAAFATSGNENKGVLSIDGRMTERLHLDQARRLLAKAGRRTGEETA